MVIYKDKQFSTNSILNLGCVENLLVNNLAPRGYVERDTSENIKNQSNMSASHRKKKPKNKKTTDSSENDEDRTRSTITLNESDLEELRTVYKKCKAVMTRIEAKYGHLLNLDEACSKKSKKNTDFDLEETDEKCQCNANKKIIFDDNGTVVTTETALDNHICPRKLKRKYSDAELNVNNVQVEYEATDILLPDDLTVLSSILKNSDIDTTYRNEVIYKMKTLKQDLTDEIKFNKKSIIDKVKTDPNEIFEFKGANFGDLPGYIL